MFFVLLALWIIFNARLTLEVLLTGIAMSALLTAFGCKYCRWNPRINFTVLNLFGRGLCYGAVLVVEIIKANIAMMKVILSKDAASAKPVLFFFDTKLKGNVAKTTLANSITLTPGTYTIGIYDSTFAVHALNEHFAEGTIDSEFNKRLCRLEGRASEEASK